MSLQFSSRELKTAAVLANSIQLVDQDANKF